MTSFWYASFKNTNLENANLYRSDLMKTDLYKIKNKSLAGADLTSTSFLLANLAGVNLYDAVLKNTNFVKTDLSGVDFTATEPTAVIFAYSNLANSNFEGVNMSPPQSHSQTFENKGHLDPSIRIQTDPYGGFSDRYSQETFWDHRKLIEELFVWDMNNLLIISTEVRGNDLVVNYVFFNNFTRANLENTNFKNVDLRYASFYLADLTNADLTGADLREAVFTNANLSNANLQGADLTEADFTGANLSYATYDQNTILNCIGHSICVN